ncbi:MAG: TRAP transporter substrate-binding protein [Alphaproteobacteria bacterium]|nr:TRAP transporter substrate-binding protein [Alphaproteobacteria bacterium]
MPKQLMLVAAGACALAVAASGASADVTLKFGHYNAESHPVHKASVQFKANVEKRSNGAVKIQLFPNNALGSPPEILEQTRNGVVDIAIPTSGQLDKYDKAFAALMIPFAFADLDHARRTMDGPVRQWLEPRSQKIGLEVIGVWEYGFRHLTNSKRPIMKPEDVKGLKIRTPPEIQLSAAMAALGANVQKIGFPELYLSLSQGVVDGEENPIATIHSAKFYEVQKYLTLTRHMYQAMFHVVNAGAWKKLSADQQKVMREESAAAGKLTRELLQSEEAGLIEDLKKKGMTVAAPDTAPFQKAMGPANEEIKKFAGADNVTTFMKYVDEARKK